MSIEILSSYLEHAFTVIHDIVEYLVSFDHPLDLLPLSQFLRVDFVNFIVKFPVQIFL